MSKPIKSVQDVLDTPIAKLDESQFTAFLEGRAAFHNGDECYRQFHDTKLCWQAGREWEQKRQAS